MGPEPKKPENFLIDVNDQEELLGIAAKLGCKVSDILLAIETLKTSKRIAVYSWLIDDAFRAHLK